MGHIYGARVRGTFTQHICTVFKLVCKTTVWTSDKAINETNSDPITLRTTFVGIFFIDANLKMCYVGMATCYNTWHENIPYPELFEPCKKCKNPTMCNTKVWNDYLKIPGCFWQLVGFNSMPCCFKHTLNSLPVGQEHWKTCPENKGTWFPTMSTMCCCASQQMWAMRIQGNMVRHLVFIQDWGLHLQTRRACISFAANMQFGVSWSPPFSHRKSLQRGEHHWAYARQSSVTCHLSNKCGQNKAQITCYESFSGKNKPGFF